MRQGRRPNAMHSSPDDGAVAASDAEHMPNWGFGPIVSALPLPSALPFG